LLQMQAEHETWQVECKRLNKELEVSEKGLKAIQSNFQEGHEELRKYFDKFSEQHTEIEKITFQNNTLSARNQQLEAWYQSQHASWSRFHADGAPPFRCNGGHESTEFHWKGMLKNVQRHSNCLCHPVLGPEEDVAQTQPPLQKVHSVDQDVMEALADAPLEMQEVAQSVGGLPAEKKIELLQFMQSDAARNWFPTPDCSGVWVEHKSSPHECQVCKKAVRNFEDGACCSQGGHRICWKPCLFKSIQWDKMKHEDVQKVMAIVNGGR